MRAEECIGHRALEVIRIDAESSVKGLYDRTDDGRRLEGVPGGAVASCLLVLIAVFQAKHDRSRVMSSVLGFERRCMRVSMAMVPALESSRVGEVGSS